MINTSIAGHAIANTTNATSNVVKYKKYFLWSKLTVTGHRLDKEINRMDFYLPDGSIVSIGNWSIYDMKLGVDWLLAVKKNMEEESGQTIKLTV